MKVKINNTPIREVVSIKIWKQTSGTFKIVYFIAETDTTKEFKKITSDLQWNASASDVKSKIKSATSWSNSVERNGLDVSGSVTTNEADIKGYRWVVTFTSWKDKEVLPFIQLNDDWSSSPNISINKQQTQSDPIRGNFKLNVNGETSMAMNYNENSTYFGDKLSQLPSLLEGVSVWRDYR